MQLHIGSWFRKNYRSIIITALVVVPVLVSLISTIHVVNFFKLSNFGWLAITLAVAFEIGALSSLAALAVMDKLNKTSLWLIFILITMMQMMGNTYYAFDFIGVKMQTNLNWIQSWIDLFGIESETAATTKRILAIISGAILPVISLTFLHLLVTYISKTKTVQIDNDEDDGEYEYVYEEQTDPQHTPIPNWDGKEVSDHEKDDYRPNILEQPIVTEPPIIVDPPKKITETISDLVEFDKKTDEYVNSYVETMDQRYPHNLVVTEEPIKKEEITEAMEEKKSLAELFDSEAGELLREEMKEEEPVKSVDDLVEETLSSSKNITAQKKKILLYKDQKKEIYNGLVDEDDAT